ncbi:MAG TPA: helix-turn-helix domain-containing protein [Actinocrinis sp.]|uniref:PucR family transcriptional regulator n=1 Tax=Actinocrinis sp. TaxID=1920516 RepID=UPI002DDCB60F|nr:helix-turn-helix domain-containing protein [Actinocrinis sp.]HEV2347681.1 helix-turn-helix domain-containing protein [Actinocrinis sp.]
MTNALSTPRAVLAAVARELADDLPDLARRAVAVITRREELYGGSSGVTADVLLVSVTANFDSMLRVLASTQTPVESDLSVPRSTGRRRAEQGLPLEAVLRAYRLGGQELLAGLVAVARRRTPAELAAFLGVVLDALDLVDRYSEAMVGGYRQAEARLQQRDSQREQAAFDALLEGGGTEAESALALGLPAQGPYLLVVSAFNPSAEYCALTTARDVCAAFSMPAVWRTRGSHEIGIVLLGATTLPVFLETVRAAAAGRTGVSGLFDSLREVPEAYRLALAALRTLPAEAQDVAWIDGLLIESIVAASPELARLVTSRILGPVLNLPSPDRELLLETLDTWYACRCSTAVTAFALSCHRNTVLNRLQRVETLTGGSFSDHRDLLMCYLALLSRRLVPLNN